MWNNIQKSILLSLSLLLPLLAAVSSQPLNINMQLPQSHTILQPESHHKVVLNPDQVYLRHSDLISPLSSSNHYCLPKHGTIDIHLIATIAQDNGNNKRYGFGVFKYRPQSYTLSEQYKTLFHLTAEGDFSSYKLPSQSSLFLQKMTTVKILKPDSCGDLQQIMIPAPTNKALHQETFQEYLFLFTCQQVYRVETQKASIEIEEMKEAFVPDGVNGGGKLDGFNGFKVLEEDGVYVWASRDQGVRVFGLTLRNTLKFMFQIEANTLGSPVADICIQNSLLYVLLPQKILIFSLLQPTESARTPHSSIDLTSLSPTPIFREIEISPDGSTLYIYGRADKTHEDFIAEMQFSRDKNQLYFIRYYKGLSGGVMFFGVDLWAGIGQFLMVVGQGLISLYERAKDPRVIDRLINGITNNHVSSDLVDFFSLGDGSKYYIMRYPSSIQLVTLESSHPYLQCQFPASLLDVPHSNPQTLIIPQPCAKNQGMVTPFSTTCKHYQRVQIFLNDSSSQMHVFVIFLVFLFCLAVIGLLMVWRGEKVDIIERLVSEINRVRRNKRENVEFMEEEPCHEREWDKQKYGTEEGLEGIEEIKEQIGQDGECVIGDEDEDEQRAQGTDRVIFKPASSSQQTQQQQ